MERPLRIALISPKGALYRHGTGIFPRSLRAAPLTMTTLAALIPGDLDAEVRIYDEGIQDLPSSIEADLIGMTVITGTANRAYELSTRYRAQGLKVILGGPHVTLLPDEAQQHADAIVTGYAEESWPRLLRDLVSGAMSPRYDMAPDFGLDRPELLPFPRRELLPRGRYTTKATFEATRGCAHRCTFCVVPSAWPEGPYTKPVEHVVEDIQRVGAKRVLFYDLNLIANRAYAMRLFTALEPLKLKWFGLATALITRDDTLLEQIARSGCRGLLIGFESVSSTSLGQLDKGFHDPHLYAEMVRALHELGIAINGTFMFGGDDDDRDSFDATLDFVLSSRIDLPRFSILTPFPGTPLFEHLDAEGRILTREWSLYDGQHVVHRPARLTPEQLIEEHERIWRAAYSLRAIADRSRRAAFDKLLVLSANLGYRYYAGNLSRFYTCTGGMA